MEDYIKRILEKIENLEDVELKQLILLLINDRQNLQDSAKIDHLTGLYNRKILDDIVDFEIVVMCDIDNFKKVNDTYGHDIGDDVLKIVSKKLKTNTRDNDIVCRYGGDEFLILFRGCSLDVVVNRMSRIQNDILNSLTSLNSDVSISVGIADCTGEKSLEEGITKADKALYISKQNGKKQITIYEKEKIYKKA